ncbi:MAG: hypothetical protein AAB969_03175 [Patescibacteria group bacterium]
MNFYRPKSKFERFKNLLCLWGISLTILAVALIPTWLYLLARFLLNPESGLVEVLLLGISLYFMGALQLIALIIGLTVIVIIWKEA